MTNRKGTSSEDATKYVVFLADDDAGFITSSTLSATNGQYLN